MIVLALVPIIMGALLGTQTAINSKLRSFIGSPYLASTVSFSVGTLFLLILSFATQGGVHLSLDTFLENPWWIWTGGLLGTIALTVNVLLFPKLGGVQTAILPIFGQIIMGLLIDQFGLLDSPKAPLTLVRFIGIVLVVSGVLLAVLRKSIGKKENSEKLLPWQIVGVIAGMLGATQTAVNGHLGSVLKSSLQAATVSFTVGTLILIIYCLISRADFSKLSLAVASGKSYWWIWIGGLLAGLYVYASAWLVPQIGTGQVVVMALFGQLTFSVVIDQFGLFEAIKSPVSRQKIIGLIIMSIGVILIKLA